MGGFQRSDPKIFLLKWGWGGGVGRGRLLMQYFCTLHIHNLPETESYLQPKVFQATHVINCFQLYTSGIKQDELFTISFRDFQQR
jgi:hypothetical protein